MKNLNKFYIDGSWVTPNSSQTMAVLNPATEMQIGTIALGNEIDVNTAVAAATKAFASYSQTSKVGQLQLLLPSKRTTRQPPSSLHNTQLWIPLVNINDRLTN